MLTSGPALLVVPLTAVALIILLVLFFLWRVGHLLAREIERERTARFGARPHSHASTVRSIDLMPERAHLAYAQYGLPVRQFQAHGLPVPASGPVYG